MARRPPARFGHHRVLPSCRRYIATLLLAIGLLAAGDPAAAQSQKKPSPEQLWEAYPLEPGSEKAQPADPAPTPTASPTPSPTATRSSAPTVPAAATQEVAGGDGLSAPVLIAGGVLAFGVGIGAGALLLRRRRGEAVPVVAMASARPAAAAPAASGESVVEPADEVEEVAEVAADEPVAADTNRAAAEPPPLWVPPATVPEPEPPPAVEEHEAEEPEMPPAQRFARRRPWPDEVAELWTCEVEWKAGYRKSTFRAMAAAPGEERRHAFGESAPIRWTLMSEPDPPTPEKVEALRGLIEALEDGGWDRIEPAGPWYAQRFVWRKDGQPRPIEPLTGKAADA